MNIRLNTVLIPEKKFVDRMTALASEIAKNRLVDFAIDNKKFMAHITLYSPEYPVKNIKKIEFEVEKISAVTNKFILPLTGFIEGDGYVMADFSKDRKIIQLHNKILKALNPLRDGIIREKYKFEIEDKKYSLLQAKLIKKYGYHSVLQYYQPHLSLCKFKKIEDNRAALNKLQKSASREKVLIDSIAISKMGPNGTCIEILRKFSLR